MTSEGGKLWIFGYFCIEKWRNLEFVNFYIFRLSGGRTGWRRRRRNRGRRIFREKFERSTTLLVGTKHVPPPRLNLKSNRNNRRKLPSLGGFIDTSVFFLLELESSILWLFTLFHYLCISYWWKKNQSENSKMVIWSDMGWPRLYYCYTPFPISIAQ